MGGRAGLELSKSRNGLNSLCAPEWIGRAETDTCEIPNLTFASEVSTAKPIFRISQECGKVKPARGSESGVDAYIHHDLPKWNSYA